MSLSSKGVFVAWVCVCVRACVRACVCSCVSANSLTVCVCVCVSVIAVIATGGITCIHYIPARRRCTICMHGVECTQLNIYCVDMFTDRTTHSPRTDAKPFKFTVECTHLHTCTNTHAHKHTHAHMQTHTHYGKPQSHPDWYLYSYMLVVF